MAERWVLTRRGWPHVPGRWSLNLWRFSRLTDTIETASTYLCEGADWIGRKVFRRTWHTCWLHNWANDLAWRHIDIVLELPLTEEQAKAYLAAHPKLAKAWERRDAD